MRRRSLLAATLLAPGLATPALGQSARRPLRLVVPFPAGGTADLLGRLAAREIEQALGAPVVVDNRAGAGGAIGSDSVARGPAEGVILLSNIASQAIGPAVNRSVPYNPVTDFRHIALVAAVPSAIAVAADGPIRSMADLVARAKAQAGAVRFGSTGIGTSSHVKLELLKRAAGVDITHVPYRGSAPATADVIGGQVEGLIAAVPDIGNNDRLRLLAITLPERAARWPDVPTVVEAGFPDLVATNWFGLSGPAGMPADQAAEINRAVVAGLNTPALVERLASLGAPPNRMTPAEYSAMVASEVTRWAEIARSANIRVE
ncbi:Bug family tripartite tricarboxylate transporter substrate binding protein [Falsiroseomonas tokyonensis]|uniref:Bug family tripartite tricarboxylate transporter substrate binding protein n=1 Tax=Falsiroseomonas tokyonensis TaxID=430521 RepID=A0ABV7BTI1_9PROT|nr:tripartite tricarboxylate transporter substrate binding protein [Falsiroseomonas tokyonensis]MBU8537760.1 tripartite tricarboxylate transporter substrate binding protein [Falsiroseomonas tokyonensis]